MTGPDKGQTAGGDKPPSAAPSGGAAPSGIGGVQAEFDVAIGQAVAKSVMKRDPRQRRLATMQEVAGAAAEPEQVGGKGSTLRRCIVSQQTFPRDEMVRFAISPEGVVTPDLEEKLPGRGYWVKANYVTLAKAVQSGAFSRAAKAQVKAGPDLPELVLSLARQAALSQLGLARRTWAVDMGYDNVRAGLLAKKIGVVLVAADAEFEYSRKLDAALLGGAPVLTLFTTAQQSEALGRESLGFVGVHKGQWSARMLGSAARLMRLMSRIET
jgi:predicted RNA-binding protein YlxR (DUF448 family)